MPSGRLYDGTNALAHAVDIALDGDSLTLSQPSGWTEHVSGAVLKRIEGPAGELRLARTDEPGWRLVLPADAEEWLAPLLGRKERYGGWIDRIGLVPAVIAGALVTAAVVGIGYTAPTALAPHVPMQWERNVGDALLGDFGDNRCRSRSGQKALEALLEKVAPGAAAEPERIRVAALDIPVFNAAALPGGHIVLFEPAVNETDTEALAGILAHEVAHVRRRHVTEALLRELGIGSLIRMFAGTLGANAQQIVGLSYTRANEAEADADSIAMLKRANIDPRPTARLFAKLSSETGEDSGFTAEFLQSHPLTGKRARRFAASAVKGARYSPPLTRDQQDALVDICSEWARRKVK